MPTSPFTKEGGLAVKTMRCKILTRLLVEQIFNMKKSLDKKQTMVHTSVCSDELFLCIPHKDVSKKQC